MVVALHYLCGFTICLRWSSWLISWFPTSWPVTVRIVTYCHLIFSISSSFTTLQKSNCVHVAGVFLDETFICTYFMLKTGRVYQAIICVCSDPFLVIGDWYVLRRIYYDLEWRESVLFKIISEFYTCFITSKWVLKI